jgi:transcriptional regulator with XRE-family HTH domain
MEPFATALGRLVKERGLEQLELAVASGCSEGAISLYIADKRHPRAETIARIAKALNLDPEHFIEYRRWKLHHVLDQWIDEDEEAVEFLLERIQLAEGPRG